MMKAVFLDLRYSQVTVKSLKSLGLWVPPALLRLVCHGADMASPWETPTRTAIIFDS